MCPSSPNEPGRPSGARGHGLRFVYALLVTLASLSTVPTSARAQRTPDESLDDEAVPGQGRGGYAWGQGGSDGSQPSGPETHRFSRVFGSLGAGASLRLFYDPDALRQDLAGPVYLQLRVGYFFEGEGDLQHGLGLGISPNVTADPTDLSYADGFLEFGQWTLAPSYLLRAWLSDEVQILASFGVPFGLSGTYQSLGLELAGGFVYKFLAGLGVYAHVTFSTYFASFVQPMLSADAGVVLDYEVLP
jgi:hypothetical protein